MKAALVITVILILVGAGLGAKLYLDHRKAVEEYPIHRTITSSDGRQIDVVIHGRSEIGLVVERLQDNQNFSIPMERLGQEDREFAMTLSINRSLPAVEEPEPSEPAPTPNDVYIQNRLEMIEKLNLKLRDLKKEIESGKLTSSLQSVRESEKLRVEEEIESLHSAIVEYKHRNGIH